MDIYKILSDSMPIKIMSTCGKKASNYVGDMRLKRAKILELPTITIAQLVRESLRQAEVPGSNPIECQMFYLFHNDLSTELTWRGVERFNYDK